jgi:hypothetical protein
MDMRPAVTQQIASNPDRDQLLERRFTSNVFLPAEQYSDAVDTLHVLCRMKILQHHRSGISSLAPDWRAVLSNSILVSCLIVREALNASSMAWHKLVYDALDSIMKLLVTGSPLEFLPIIDLSKMYRDGVSEPLSARAH